MPSVTKPANSHTVVSTGWTNPANAQASTGDNVYATTLNGSTSKNISASGDFGFANIGSGDIPDGATIDEVRIRCEADLTAATTGALFGVVGRINGADSGSETTKTTTGEEEVVTVMSGVTLSDLRSASTLVKARCRGAKGNSSTAVTVRLDYVRLEVDYTEVTGDTFENTATVDVTATIDVTNEVETPSVPGYITLDGTGDYVLTADKNQLDITGDIDIIANVRLTSWTASQIQNIITKGDTGGSAGSWILRTPSANPTMQWVWRTAGGANVTVTSTSLASALGLGLSTALNGVDVWIRVTLDVDNGAGNRVTTFYASLNPVNTAPGSVTWTQVSQTSTAGTTSINAGTAAVVIGSRADLPATEYMTGRVSYAEIRDGIGGTRVANPDPRFGTQGWGSPPATDNDGNSWSLHGDAAWTAPVGGATTYENTATVDTTATVTATAVTVYPSSATVDADATITPTAVAILPASTTVDATATVDVTNEVQTASPVWERDATVDATATITPTAAVVYPNTATVDATASINVTAEKIQPASSTVAATATLTATAVAIFASTTTVDATATVNVTTEVQGPTPVWEREASVDATATITATLQLVQAVSVQVDANATVTPTAVTIYPATATVGATATINATNEVETPDVNVYENTVTVDATATTTTGTMATFAVSATVDGVGSVVATSSATAAILPPAIRVEFTTGARQVLEFGGIGPRIEGA